MYNLKNVTLLGARRSHPSSQIENLKGKQFVFQIQLNDYNLKYGRDFYTIKKLFDSFEEIDKAIQLDKITKVHIL